MKNVEVFQLARMREPRFKKCRRLNLNVCGHPKAMNRAGNGQGRDSRKLSTYGIQLLEKQRLKGYYEVLEKQFKRYVEKAMRSKGLVAENLIKSLECRLDNMVYRMNFASSIRQARQIVVHGHLLVNGKKVDRPSFAVSVGDIITLKEESRNIEMFKLNFNERATYNLPYIHYDLEQYTATLERYPEKNEVPIEINDQLVVEYYSRSL